MGKSQINFVVNDEQKKRWEEYQEDAPNAESLSQLIRISVEHEIAEDRDFRSKQQPSGEVQLSEDSEVVGTLQSIQNTVKSMDERLGVVERESSSKDYSIQKVVYELLPTPDIPAPDPPFDAGDVQQPEGYGITAEQLANKIDADTKEVRDALDGLVDATSSVKRAVSDNAYYWRAD